MRTVCGPKIVITTSSAHLRNVPVMADLCHRDGRSRAAAAEE